MRSLCNRLLHNCQPFDEAVLRVYTYYRYVTSKIHPSLLEARDALNA